MKRILCILALATFTLIACDKVKEETYLESTIGISAGVDDTKALLSSVDAAGTKVQIYDFLSDFTGTIVVNGTNVTESHTSGDFFEYFSDILNYPGGSGAWTYQSGNSYRWTRTGTHHFLGWLSDDAGQTGLNYSAFWGEQPDFDTNALVLSVPSKTITTATEQFDFLYAPARSLSPGDAGYGQLVNLPLSHLFTAFSITVQNVSDNEVVLKSITSSGLFNTKSADIDLSDGTVTYPTSSAANFIPAFSNQTLPAETGTFTLWSGHKIMWPQTGAEMQNAQLILTYDILDDDDTPTEYTSTIELKNIRISGVPITTTGLEAGKKYTFTLQFKNGSIELFPYVAPWDYIEESWDYADNSISARTGSEYHDGVLMLYKGGVAGSNYTIEIFNTTETVTGEFYIYAPHHGRWQVSLYPAEAAQYFTITPSSGIIDEEMLTTQSGRVSFTIKASSLTPEFTETAYCNISIYMGNEWHDANSEFNRKNWKIKRVVS